MIVVWLVPEIITMYLIHLCPACEFSFKSHLNEEIKWFKFVNKDVIFVFIFWSKHTLPLIYFNFYYCKKSNCNVLFCRSVFGGTVGPNPSKNASYSGNGQQQQYYEGIKVRAHPLILNVQLVSNTNANATTSVAVTPTPSSVQPQQVRRKLQTSAPVIVSVASCNPEPSSPISTCPPSPASPILKAQLSAPSKGAVTSKCDFAPKSQVTLIRCSASFIYSMGALAGVDTNWLLTT